MQILCEVEQALLQSFSCQLFAEHHSVDFCFADLLAFLVIVVTPVADLTCDIKKEVKAAAVLCMEAICQCTGNKDLEPFLPAVILAAQFITNTHSCVDKLAGCIFVQNVECPALAATLPVLARGLTDKSEEVNRTCCQIVDNMCKLVEDPAEVLPLMPRLEPLVKNAKERISDPEARVMSERAYNTLMKAAGQGAADVVVVSLAWRQQQQT